MNDQDDDESRADGAGAPAPRATAVRQPGSRSSGLWWKILLFASGVLVGVLGVGLLNVTTPDFATTQAAGGTAPAQSQSGNPVPAGAEARVNAACLGVINEAQDVYAVLGDLGQALDNVDLTALDDIVRRLQPIEPRLGRDLTGCRVDTSVTSGSTPTATGPPTDPEPTTGPTSGPPTGAAEPSTSSSAPQPSATR
ncbi:MAG: hypothetical protein EOP01_00160 [Propionibacteriaceae bacterium]|nr:MAG: hypothetical protein EOP01_00160 [Propionibacteriaceae bacterium]